MGYAFWRNLGKGSCIREANRKGDSGGHRLGPSLLHRLMCDTKQQVLNLVKRLPP